MATLHMDRVPETERSSDQDIDQLFAPETPSDTPHHPRLLFTEPDDRDANLFADEVTAFAEQRVLVPAPPPVPLVARRPPSAQTPARKEPSLRASQVVAALAVSLVVLFVLLMPNGRPTEAPESGTAARQLPEPQPDARVARAAPPPAPPASLAAPVQPESSAASRPVPLPPARAAKVTKPPAQAAPPPSASTRRSPAPQVPTPVVPSPTTARAPRPSASDEPVRSTPGLDVRRLDQGTATVLGEPVAAPPAEVPPVVVATERGGFVRRDLPAASPGGTVTAAGDSSPDARGLEREKVRGLLSQYQRAYSDLDAAAAARVYPRVDRRALSRAFSTLSAQQIQLDDCRIDLLQSAARATCAGTASWTPKVGGGSQDQARRWQFELKQIAGNWQIDTVKVQ